MEESTLTSQIQESEKEKMESWAQHCSICYGVLSSKDGFSLRCFHLFHKSCLNRWFKEKDLNCPICELFVSFQVLEQFEEICHTSPAEKTNTTPEFGRRNNNGGGFPPIEGTPVLVARERRLKLFREEEKLRRTGDLYKKKTSRVRRKLFEDGPSSSAAVARVSWSATSAYRFVRGFLRSRPDLADQMNDFATREGLEVLANAVVRAKVFLALHPDLLRVDPNDLLRSSGEENDIFRHFLRIRDLYEEASRGETGNVAASVDPPSSRVAYDFFDLTVPAARTGASDMLERNFSQSVLKYFGFKLPAPEDDDELLEFYKTRPDKMDDVLSMARWKYEEKNARSRIKALVASRKL